MSRIAVVVVVALCCFSLNSVIALTTQVSWTYAQDSVYPHQLAMFGASRPVLATGAYVMAPAGDIQLCRNSSIAAIRNATGPVVITIWPPPGPMVFAQRGGCTFLEKAQIAQAAGAKALIVINYGAYTTPMGAIGDTSSITIAVVSISSNSFAAIKKDFIPFPNVNPASVMTVTVDRTGDVDDSLSPSHSDSTGGNIAPPPNWGSGGEEPEPVPRYDHDHDTDDDNDDDSDRTQSYRGSRKIAGFVFTCVIITAVMILCCLICCVCRHRRRAAAAAAAGGQYHQMQYRFTPAYDPYAMQPMQPMQFVQAIQPMQPMQPMPMQPMQAVQPIYYYPVPQLQPQGNQAPRVVVVHTPQVQPTIGQPPSAAQSLA